MTSEEVRHRVYLSFQDRHGWQCQFLEADLQTPLPAAVVMLQCNHKSFSRFVCGPIVVVNMFGFQFAKASA